MDDRSVPGQLLFVTKEKAPVSGLFGVAVKLELCEALKDCTVKHRVHRDIAIFADLEHLFVEVHG